MNAQLVKYTVALGISAVISTCSFSMYLDKLKVGKHKSKKVVEDIPEEEIEPTDFEMEE